MRRLIKAKRLEVVSVNVGQPSRFYTSSGKTFAIVKMATVLRILRKTKFTENSSMLAIRR